MPTAILPSGLSAPVPARLVVLACLAVLSCLPAPARAGDALARRGDAGRLIVRDSSGQRISDYSACRINVCPATDAEGHPLCAPQEAGGTAGGPAAPGWHHRAEVARALGRHQPFIANIESGERRLDVVELVELADILGFDPHAVIDQLESIPQERGRKR